MVGQITFQDELTINNLSEIAVNLRDAFKRYDEVTVDITDVKHIDIAALQVLIAAKKECLNRNKNLIIKMGDAVSSMLSFNGVRL